MVVWVAQLVGHSIQKEISPFCVKIIYKPLENIHWSTVSNRSRECCQLLRCLAMKLLYSLFIREPMLIFRKPDEFLNA